MKKDQKQALRDASKAELQTKLAELQTQLVQAQVMAAAGKLEDTAKIRRLRDQIAVVKTINTEKGKQA